MSEEKVTIGIINWLERLGWKIICYDYPQSGTGVLLHPNTSGSFSKNRGSIIPDIIAVKNNIAVYFENKDRFVMSDIKKIREIKNLKNYSLSLESLLKNYCISEILFGIGMPNDNRYIKKALDNIEGVDFVIIINESDDVDKLFDKYCVFC